jgi:hypothetical protein
VERNPQLAFKPPLNAQSTADVQVQDVEIFSLLLCAKATVDNTTLEFRAIWMYLRQAGCAIQAAAGMIVSMPIVELHLVW